jgi:hypothetical protein
VPGSFWDFPAPRMGAAVSSKPPYRCSEVLASALVIPLRPAGTSPSLGEEFKGYFLLGFSPVVGARRRPPMSKIACFTLFIGKTVRIIRNPTTHCKQGDNTPLSRKIRDKLSQISARANKIKGE